MAWFFRHRPLIYNGLKERRRRRVHACERGKGWGWGRRENFWIVVNNRGRLISHFPISESGIWWSQNEYIDDITKWTSCWSFEDGAETGRVHPVPQEVQKYSGFKRSHATARGIFQKGISYFSLKLLFPSPPPPEPSFSFFAISPSDEWVNWFKSKICFQTFCSKISTRHRVIWRNWVENRKPIYESKLILQKKRENESFTSFSFLF